MSFAQPWLLLLLPIPLLLVLYQWRRRRALVPAARYSSLDLLGGATGSRGRWRWVLPWLRVLSLTLLLVALARPRFGETEIEVRSEGVDIVLALDVSGSMRAEDFKPENRLHVAKNLAAQFIRGRVSDRIGLVVFAGNSYTHCPLTTDYEVLLRLLEEVDFGEIPDGTAIGMAVANGVNRLKDVPGGSRVLILLTDGVNNAGAVDPITAAELARSLDVRVHTVGIGALEEAPFPVDDPVFGRRYVSLPADVDGESLTRMAEITGGRYFRAVDARALDDVFREIDRMEKVEAEVREWVNYSEFGSRLAIPVLALLLLEMILGATLLRRLP